MELFRFEPSKTMYLDNKNPIGKVTKKEIIRAAL
jgi:hypothetical protein